jgi:hypothetical protein
VSASSPLSKSNSAQRDLRRRLAAFRLPLQSPAIIRCTTRKKSPVEAEHDALADAIDRRHGASEQRVERRHRRAQDERDSSA